MDQLHFIDSLEAIDVLQPNLAGLANSDFQRTFYHLSRFLPRLKHGVTYVISKLFYWRLVLLSLLRGLPILPVGIFEKGFFRSRINLM